MYMDNMLGWHWGMWIFFIAFWLLVILGIVMVIKWFSSQASSRESSLEVLEKRYAKGEISEEDFNKTKEKITERRS